MMPRTKSLRPHWLLPGIMCLLVMVGYPTSAYDASQSPNAPYLPTLDVTLAWEGYVRTPGWTEIHVTLTNEADLQRTRDGQSPDEWHGDLLITDNFHQVTYRQALQLPARSRKHYRIPLFIDEIHLLDITLKSEEYGVTQKLDSASGVSLRQPFDGLVCAIADAQTPSQFDRLVFASAAKCDSIVHLGNSLTKLPETAIAWDTIDILVLNGVDATVLTSAQQQAMLAWVSAGGHLIVGGGPALPQTIAGLSDALQIAHLNPTIKLTQTLSLENRRLTLSTNQVVVPLQPKSGAIETVMLDSDNGLAIHRDIGVGQMDLIGWDLSLAKGAFFWVGTLWAEDIPPAVALFKTEEASPDALTLSNVAIPNKGQTLMQVPATIIPKLWYLLLLFPFYLFLMGPGTMLIVRRLRRPILAWILLPIWVILGISIMAFQLTGTFSQSFPIINDVAVVAASGPQLPARVVQSTAIFAPQIRRLSWRSNGVPRPLWGHYTTEGWYNSGEPFNALVSRTGADPPTIQVNRPLGVLTWASEGLIVGPSITSTLRLIHADNRVFLQGKIASDTDLRQVSLHTEWGKIQYPILDYLASTHPVTLSQVLTDPLTLPNRLRYQDLDLCAQVGNAQASPYTRGAPPVPQSNTSQPSIPIEGRCYLSGVMDSVPFPPEAVGGTHIAETCLIYAIPCPRQRLER